MVRNSEGKIVDENGVEVFKSDVFKQLSGPDHLIKVCPSTKFLNFQMEKAYLPNPEDTRKFVEYHFSKLVDDNTSLASNDEIHHAYIDDVVCLLGMINGIDKKAPQDVKNSILGGTFPTKNDNSEDSKVPLYLVTEMLKAKCQKDLGKQVSNLDNYDLGKDSTVVKDSTLGSEFDKVVNAAKQLDFDKELFSGDMSKESMDYFERCSYTLNVDTAKNNPPIDNYAKVEADKCSLFVTQGDIVNNIKMFDITKKQEASVNLEIPAIEKPVIAVPTVEQQPVNTDAPKEANSGNDLEEKRENAKKVSSEIKDLDAKIKELTTLRAQKEAELHEIYESMFKKTPAEEEAKKQAELQQMVTQQAQPVVPSINAQMFK